MSSGYPFPIKSSFSCIFFVMLWYKWRLFVILFMILHEFPIVPLKYSKNSRWNNDFCHHLPFLMARHTRKIWLGGRATVFPFTIEIREWKVWQGGRATWFPFLIEMRESAVLEWGRATIGLQKECHVRFGPIYGIPREQNASKTRETCEKHTRNTRVYPASDCTAPARLSPSFMRRGYYPCRCHEKVKILKGMYSKWGCPYSQKLLFQI